MVTLHEVRDRRDDVVADVRPWGGFRVYACNETCTVKLISVEVGQRLSLQRHAHRDELWVMLDDGLSVRVGDEVTEARAGQEFFIPRGTLHRVWAERGPARFMEVCFGDFDEDDIERLDDLYGRA